VTAAFDHQQRTAPELRALAEAWYRQQVSRSEKSMGSFWPQHREWVEAYLKAELRQKLIERGWRPRP
jgi:hypothetical protein